MEIPPYEITHCGVEETPHPSFDRVPGSDSRTGFSWKTAKILKYIASPGEYPKETGG
jgi:hypothetical protein